MGRMPYHVHIIPYSIQGEEVRYALFERSDLPGFWQGICGGGESGESIVQAALRECREEGNIVNPGPLYPLDCVGYMAAPSRYAEYLDIWGPDVLLVPTYHLAMPYDGGITISEEHLQYRWCSEKEGLELIPIQDQKTALWELGERLRRGNLQRPLPGEWQRNLTI